MRRRKDVAPDVDGQTAADYARNLLDNLQSLLERAKSGTYRAPPVRRAEIPKGDGSETHPLGIPTFENKILQREAHLVRFADDAVLLFQDETDACRSCRSGSAGMDRGPPRKRPGWCRSSDRPKA